MPGAYGQAIAPNNDGIGTTVTQQGNTFNISGGTQAGANLYQSLQRFGLDSNQIVNFLSQPNIQNILTRVTGGEASIINGLIQVTGGNSNLYIMNPAGILFGANASLNVPASFTATTANAIKVGDQWFGMNTSVDALNTMTGTPNGYAFLNGNTGAIVNQGNLSLSAGQTLTLVGGLVLNTGTITTPEGKINIAASEGGRFVKITPEGSLLSFELPIAEQTNIAPTTILNAVNLPALLTGQPAGTAIAKGQLSVGQGGSTSFIHVLGERVDATDAQIAAGSGTGASN